MLAGKDNRLPDIEACRAVCRENEECTAWLYCWHAGGCDDGIGFETSRCGSLSGMPAGCCMWTLLVDCNDLLPGVHACQRTTCIDYLSYFVCEA